MAPAFNSDATLKRLKPGFCLVIAAKSGDGGRGGGREEGGGGQRDKGTQPTAAAAAADLQGAKPPLAEAVEADSASDAPPTAAPKITSLTSLLTLKKAANAFGRGKTKGATAEELPAHGGGGLPRTLADLFSSLVPLALRAGAYDLDEMWAERTVAAAAVVDARWRAGLQR
jgi:hypothetical protein